MDRKRLHFVESLSYLEQAQIHPVLESCGRSNGNNFKSQAIEMFEKRTIATGTQPSESATMQMRLPRKSEVGTSCHTQHMHMDLQKALPAATMDNNQLSLRRRQGSRSAEESICLSSSESDDLQAEKPAMVDKHKTHLTKASGSLYVRKPKAIKSVHQELESIQRLANSSLVARFPTISSYSSHLKTFESISIEGIFSAFRITFVNGQSKGLRNSFDTGVRNKINVLLRQGATLISPEDFVASEPGATSSEWEEVASDENWTTHVVSYSDEVYEPDYKSVLNMLGPSGLEEAQIGPYVKIVKYQWVSESVKAKKAAAEWPFCYDSDKRRRRFQVFKEAPSRRKPSERHPDSSIVTAVKSKEISPRDQISPFDADDWPLSEKAPDNYFAI